MFAVYLVLYLQVGIGWLESEAILEMLGGNLRIDMVYVNAGLSKLWNLIVIDNYKFMIDSLFFFFLNKLIVFIQAN